MAIQSALQAEKPWCFAAVKCKKIQSIKKWTTNYNVALILRSNVVYFGL